jgi:hypothetical protein
VGGRFGLYFLLFLFNHLVSMAISLNHIQIGFTCTIMLKKFTCTYLSTFLNYLFSRTWNGYSVKKGPRYAPQRKKFVADLTHEMLQRYTICLNFRRKKVSSINDISRD